MALPLNTILQIAYLLSASLFILGIKKLGSPATARRGNTFASLGMLIAIIATLLQQEVVSFQWIIVGVIVGGAIGAVSARLVAMTDMPQMVALFNGLGGGASALVALGEYYHYSQPENLGALLPLIIALSVLIGSITFTGSLIAFGKLQGWVSGQAVTFPGQKIVNGLIALGIVALSILFAQDPSAENFFVFLTGLALLLGILFVLPIGGADMPVVISFLNSASGLAAGVAGFVVSNQVLIISGALVGASGLILTQIMCKGMNRTLSNVLFGSWGASASAQAEDKGERNVRSVDAEEAAMILGYAKSVIIVPGYGMAVAQAQHAVRELTDLMESRQVDVKFAIHPVAGRMPGHMNVLLAEANVPYNKLYDMEDINPEFPKTDVALVMGANDVVNPAAKSDPGSPIYGMPVLNVDQAKHVIVIKRSLNPGFSGIDNDLFYDEKTMMFFSGAKQAAEDLIREVKELG